MLARRIIVVSPDKALAKQVTVALKAAGGTVDAHATVDELGSGELQAALIVLHLEGAVAGVALDVLRRLAGEARMIAILPRTNLAALVDIMQASDRVAGMLVAEDLDPHELSAMATRVLAGDIFGLDKLIRWGTQIHSQLVGDYQEKALCIAQISEFAEQLGVRRKYREAIEQCIDEMLMNALYDAPVDEEGRQIFAEVPTKTRIALRVEQKVVVQYACDGQQFAVAVRDVFGTLERATVLRYLHKCLHNEQQIDRKAGGAGLGLYLMVSNATQVYFNVLPGVATEAVCAFDLTTPKLHLDAFGFFTEKIDAGGRLAAGPSRKLPVGAAHPVERRAARAAPPTGLIAVLLAAIAVTLALVGYVAWPRDRGPARADVSIDTTPRGATVELEGKHAGTTATGPVLVRGLEIGRPYPVLARLDGHEPRSAVVQPREGGTTVSLSLVALAATVVVDSQPGGATVTVDGAAAGTTPLRLTTLAPSAQVTLGFAKPGFQPATTTLEVPTPGKEIRLVQPLAVDPTFARVRLASEPAGAQVTQNGQLLPGVTTPAEVLVEADKPVRFQLAAPGRVPAIVTLTPTRGSDVAREVTLVAGRPLAIAANLPATATVRGAPHCQALAAPATCVLAAGKYALELAVQGGKLARTIVVGDRDVEARFELGTVVAGEGVTLQGGARQRVVEAGRHKVTVVDAGGPRVVEVVVAPGATVVAK